MKNRPMTAQQEAYSYLQAQILNGHFPGGGVIRPDAIAQALGISRIPVREALRQLHSEGLITLRPNRGAVVTKLGATEINELFEMRAVFEGLAARHAMEYADGPFFEEMEHLNRRMALAYTDARVWIERHNEFHTLMCRQSRRPILNTEIERLRGMVQPYILMYIDVYGNPEMQGKEHAALLESLRSRDPDVVETSVRDHILSAARGLTEFIRGRVVPQTEDLVNGTVNKHPEVVTSESK